MNPQHAFLPPTIITILLALITQGDAAGQSASASMGAVGGDSVRSGAMEAVIRPVFHYASTLLHGEPAVRNEAFREQNVPKPVLSFRDAITASYHLADRAAFDELVRLHASAATRAAMADSQGVRIVVDRHGTSMSNGERVRILPSTPRSMFINVAPSRYDAEYITTLEAMTLDIMYGARRSIILTHPPAYKDSAAAVRLTPFVIPRGSSLPQGMSTTDFTENEIPALIQAIEAVLTAFLETDARGDGLMCRYLKETYALPDAFRHSPTIAVFARQYGGDAAQGAVHWGRMMRDPNVVTFFGAGSRTVQLFERNLAMLFMQTMALLDDPKAPAADVARLRVFWNEMAGMLL